jgi:hypothetical protein
MNFAETSTNPLRERKSIIINPELPCDFREFMCARPLRATRVTVSGTGLTNRYTRKALNYLEGSCAGICADVARCRISLREEAREGVDGAPPPPTRPTVAAESTEPAGSRSPWPALRFGPVSPVTNNLATTNPTHHFWASPRMAMGDLI